MNDQCFIYCITQLNQLVIFATDRNKKWLHDKRIEFEKIEFDNQLMLDRMAKAVQSSNLDNKMHSSISFHREFKAKQLEQAKRSRIARITWENKQMLHRIQHCEPAYNNTDWEESNARHEVIKRTMALYPGQMSF